MSEIENWSSIGRVSMTNWIFTRKKLCIDFDFRLIALQDKVIYAKYFEHWLCIEVLVHQQCSSLFWSKKVLFKVEIDSLIALLDYPLCKVIYSKYHKHWLYTLAPTIDSVCLKTLYLTLTPEKCFEGYPVKYTKFL